MSAARPTEGDFPATGRRIAIIAARFNDVIVAGLLEGAVGAWRKRGGEDRDLLIVRVPGAFELPLVARRLASSGRYEALVALGCVIRGDTPHFDHVAGQASLGLAAVQLETGVPVAFGVLTTHTIEQAIDRAGGKSGNKGYDAAITAIEMADLMRRLRK